MAAARPTLAVATGPLWRTPLEDAFAAIKAAGGEAVEILVTQAPDTQSPRAIEAMSARYDLPVVAIHAPLLLLTRRVYTTKPLEKIRRTVELTRALGVRTVVLHPPYLWQMRYALWLLNELEEAAAGSGTTLTMENMYPVQIGKRRLGFHRFGDVEGLQRFPHVTLDTSHLAVSGEDIVEAYDQLRSRVVHVHLSDNRGKGRDSHAPLGEGVLPIAAFLETLDPSVVQAVSLELNPGPGVEGRQGLEELLGTSIDLVRRYLPAVTPDTGPAVPAPEP